MKKDVDIGIWFDRLMAMKLIKNKDNRVKKMSFDPSLRDFYLVQEASRSGGTLTNLEKIRLLVRKYKVSFSLAQKAVEKSEERNWILAGLETKGLKTKKALTGGK